MLNYIWASFILIGIIYALVAGNIEGLTTAALDSAAEAVGLCVRMLGIMSMWTGMMRIAEESGLIKALSKALQPALGKLFPGLMKHGAEGGRAMEHISTNVIANILGLGWAATPPGIKAMEELQAINPDKSTASREMCMFLIVNLSSLQLVSINIIAYRAQYASVNPQEIIGPGILATLVSTGVGIIFAKIMEKKVFK
ncbi:MAG: nucleoside recognition protein [Clostridiales bacterium]|jgi:spore maturation protein A|nr:nucleoside recognition protein [Clostridiales bacterium]